MFTEDFKQQDGQQKKKWIYKKGIQKRKRKMIQK
jgi:hypothetical protein